MVLQQSLKRKEKIPVCITCECGAMVFGSSQDHANANLKLHKKSKKHKMIMEFKKKEIKE